MSAYNKSKYVGPNDINGITQDEYELLTEVMKKEEFRKMFMEYCEEISDPENRKIYEAELTQLERERGVDVTFINPEPGFVIKTSVDGEKKCFINVAHSDKVERPSCEHVKNGDGESGMNWKLPYTMAPARRDYDKNNKECVVYDVVFHTDTIKMADGDKRYRRIVIDTALDGVQSSFGVLIDRNNLKYPNLKYKGIAKPTVIRKRTELPDDYEESPIDEFFPPLPNDDIDHPQQTPSVQIVEEVVEQFTTPKYKIVQRRDVDLQECVNDVHSKMNTTIPKELVITIDLPLLCTTEDATLDVTAKDIFLLSERPAKYKLKVELPYKVNERDGTAKFDKSKKKLIITLPVLMNSTKIEMISKNVKHFDEEKNIVEEFKIQPNENTVIDKIKNEDDDDLVTNEDQDKFDFLDSNTLYKFPPYTFTQITSSNNKMNSQVFSLKINLNNINPSSLEFKKYDDNDINTEDNGSKNALHFKFYAIGHGFFPVCYAFFLRLTAKGDDSVGQFMKILSKEFHQEFFEVKIQLDGNIEKCKYYSVGVDEENLTESFLNDENTHEE